MKRGEWDICSVNKEQKIRIHYYWNYGGRSKYVEGYFMKSRNHLVSVDGQDIRISYRNIILPIINLSTLLPFLKT